MGVALFRAWTFWMPHPFSIFTYTFILSTRYYDRTKSYPASKRYLHCFGISICFASWSWFCSRELYWIQRIFQWLCFYLRPHCRRSRRNSRNSPYGVGERRQRHGRHLPLHPWWTRVYLSPPRSVQRWRQRKDPPRRSHCPPHQSSQRSHPPHDLCFTLLHQLPRRSASPQCHGFAPRQLHPRNCGWRTLPGWSWRPPLARRACCDARRQIGAWRSWRNGRSLGRTRRKVWHRDC